MNSTQKYHKLFFFLTICTLFCAGCGFPYNTRQARVARKANQLAKKELQKNPVIIADTTVLASIDSTQLINPADSSQRKEKGTTKGGKLKISSPDTSTVTQVIPLKGGKMNTRITTDSSGQIVGIDSTQLDSVLMDSIAIDSNAIALLDSIATIPDSLILPKEKGIRFSKDSMNLPVQYEAADSMIYDIIARKVYMYGNAEVYYEQYELKAGYIEFDFRTNVAMATCLIDSTGEEVECPVFDDKQQQFDSRRIEFNFKTKKGKVYDASTKQGDGYLVSNATKFISDSTGGAENTIYSQGCIYTTCDHKHPHFGIRASKAKIIPNKLIVVGPSYLEIMGSPTPIVLPFGFFPLTKNKRSGLILSPDLDFSPTLGPGLRGNGFYLGLSEYWDLKVTGDFYMRGSMRAYVLSNYNIKYKGQGNVKLGYTRIKIDEFGTPDYDLQQSFNFSWTHTQATQAHPSQSFSASVNFGTSDYYKSTFNDANNVLQATISSRVSFSKRFLGTPFSLTANMTHSQNTKTRQMTINLPVINLVMNQIFPFQRKNKVGKSRWYERIGFSYSVSAKNTINTSDTTFFTADGFRDAIDNMNYNITHSPRLNMSFKLFKLINVQPSVNYSQNWYFYKSKQYLDATPDIDANGDTTQYGSVETYRDYGLFTTHDFSAGINLNTQIYATGTFNVLGLNQLRAILTPNVGFSWRPSYENANDYYFDSVQTDTRYPEQLRRYNNFGYTPPGGKTALLTYSLTGRFEGKIKKGKRDSTLKTPYKKVILIPNVTLNGNYNLAADSLHFSPINFNTYTTLFKKINVRFAATFDPYSANKETNARINTFEYAVSRRLLRVTSMSFNASTAFNSNDFRKLFKKKDKKEDDKKPSFDLLDNIAIDYNFIINNRFVDGVDTMLVVANQISFSGTVNLSQGWKIRVGRIGYDFSAKRITYPDFTFSRDLHCWQMGLSWQPERRTWSFFLKTKPGSLSFLNVPVKKEFFDRF